MNQLRRKVPMVFIACAIVLVMGMTTGFSQNVFVFDLIANLRVQVAMGIAFVFALAAWDRQWRSCVLLLVALGMTVGPVAWGWRLARPPSGASNSPWITVTTLNVLSRNDQSDRVLGHLESIDPDVFAILELTSTWHDRIQDRFATSHPYHRVQPSDHGNFGIGLYSRIAFQDAKVIDLGGVVPSIDVVLESPRVRILATHPVPPMSSENFDLRNRQLDQIARHLQTSPTPGAVVLMGDLNLTPWSPIFRDFVDASRLRPVRDGAGIRPTWYGGPPYLPFGLVLDHILVSDGVEPIEFAIGDDVGSDHRSVTAGLSVE